MAVAQPATAQDGRISDRDVVADDCAAVVRSVQPLSAAGRYAVEFARADGSSAPVTLRVDDRIGFWLYPPTDRSRVIIDVPGAPRGPINVTTTTVHDAAGEVACRKTVNVSAGPAKPEVQESMDTIVLTPQSRSEDNPATCDVPFRRPQAPAMRSFPLPSEVRGTSGTVTLAILVSSDGSIERVRIVESPSAALGGAVAATLQRSTFMPALFRCMPIESPSFFRIQVRSSSRP